MPPACLTLFDDHLPLSLSLCLLFISFCLSVCLFVLLPVSVRLSLSLSPSFLAALPPSFPLPSSLDKSPTYHARPEAGLEVVRRRPRRRVHRGGVPEGRCIFHRQGLLPRVHLPHANQPQRAGRRRKTSQGKFSQTCIITAEK